MAKATAPSPVPTDPVELLATPLAKSGLAAGALLRRAGIRLGFYTVRDLLFHLPRRYDDRSSSPRPCSRSVLRRS